MMDQTVNKYMLAVRDLHAGYEGASVLHGVTVEVRESETVAILGANGAGKTTLLMAISGVVPIISGDIELDGRSIRGMRATEIVCLGLAHVPEGRLIFPDLTVAENLILTARLRFNSHNAKQHVERILGLFPRLRERYRVAGGVLSGGEQQMLAIARALVTSPRALLLDEPSLGLAPTIADHVFELLARIKADGTTILLVEQNAELALELADKAYVMESGRINLSAPTENLAADSRITDSYLGVRSNGNPELNVQP